MKYIIAIASVVLLLAASTSVFSQRKKTASKPLKRDTVQKLPVRTVQVTLGSARLAGGTVSKRLFDSMARQGLRSSDPDVVIEGFNFTYLERNLYEDSVGNAIAVTDVISEYCPGDSLSRGLRLTLADHTKRGDTAYFEAIRGRHSKGQYTAKAQGLMFVLQ